jgi:hypothetical protein
MQSQTMHSLLFISLYFASVSALKCIEKTSTQTEYRIRKETYDAACYYHYPSSSSVLDKAAVFGIQTSAFNDKACALMDKVWPIGTKHECCTTDLCNYVPELKNFFVCAVGTIDSTGDATTKYDSVSLHWTEKSGTCVRLETSSGTVYNISTTSTCPPNASCCESNTRYACNAPNGMATYFGLKELERTNTNGGSFTSDASQLIHAYTMILLGLILLLSV